MAKGDLGTHCKILAAACDFSAKLIMISAVLKSAISTVKDAKPDTLRRSDCETAFQIGKKGTD